MTLDLDWLADDDRAWVGEDGYLLEAIWAHFHVTGEWPETVELQRRLHVEDARRRPAEAIASMPRALGLDEWANPRRLRLTIFGLGCCPGARRLLTDYVAVAQLALRRFGKLDLPNRLSRADVVADLGIGEPEIDRLSVILMPDADFLASGSSGRGDWDREIDPRVVDFSAVEDPDGLLAFLAARRRIAVRSGPVTAPPDVEPTHLGQDSARGGDDTAQRHLSLLVALSTVAIGVASFLATLSGHSPLFAGVLVAVVLVIGLGVYSLFVRRPGWVAITLVVSTCLVALIAGWVLRGDGSPHLYRYFATPREHAIAVPVIESRAGALMATSAVYGRGAQVEVVCVVEADHLAWAKLPDATFIPLGDLTPEFAATDGPLAC
jgi:hypothetical protein